MSSRQSLGSRPRTVCRAGAGGASRWEFLMRARIARARQNENPGVGPGAFVARNRGRSIPGVDRAPVERVVEAGADDVVVDRHVGEGRRAEEERRGEVALVLELHVEV